MAATLNPGIANIQSVKQAIDVQPANEQILPAHQANFPLRPTNISFKYLAI